MHGNRIFILPALLLLALATGFAADKNSTPTYDLNTLQGRVASLNGTAGLQIRF